MGTRTRRSQKEPEGSSNRVQPHHVMAHINPKEGGATGPKESRDGCVGQQDQREQEPEGTGRDRKEMVLTFTSVYFIESGGGVEGRVNGQRGVTITGIDVRCAIRNRSNGPITAGWRGIFRPQREPNWWSSGRTGVFGCVSDTSDVSDAGQS